MQASDSGAGELATAALAEADSCAAAPPPLPPLPVGSRAAGFQRRANDIIGARWRATSQSQLRRTAAAPRGCRRCARAQHAASQYSCTAVHMYCYHVSFKKMTDPRTHRFIGGAILYEIYSREFRRKNTRIFTFQFYSSCWSEFLRSVHDC